MTDEDTSSETTEVTETKENLDDTIESLAAEFQVTKPESGKYSSGKSSTSVEQSPAQPTVNPFVPDPLDADQFKTYVNGQTQTVEALKSQIQALNDKLSNVESERINSQVKTEVSKAVERVGKGLDFPKSMVKAHLEGYAEDNPNFMRIWENRHSNPKALNKALEAIRADIKDQWAVTRNQDALENQQAAKTSQQAMATKSKESTGNSLQDRFDNAKTESEREHLWARLVQTGSL